MRLKTSTLLICLGLGYCMPLWAMDANSTNPATAVPTQVAVAAATNHVAVKYTSVEGITEYRLANGLRVLLAPDDSKPTTTVNVTYMVGSKMENYGETGMAHLLEHLVFKGTPSMPGKTIVQEFAKRGMNFNGTTGEDRTNYYQIFAASDENLEWALRMEADRMVNSVIARADLDSEMTVVRNEMERGENNPTAVLIEKMLASAYQWHNYGKTVIGARSDVEGVDIARLQAFYRTYYQPDNAALIITGKFDVAKTLAWVTQYFAPIPRPTRQLPPTYTVEPVQDGAREVNLQRVGDTQIVSVLYHVAPGSHPDYPAVEVLAQILGDTPSGRLHKALVEKKLAAGVFAWPADMKDPGHVFFGVQLDKRQSRDVAKIALLGVLENIKAKPITEAELQRAKTTLLNDYEKSLADPVRFGVELSDAVAKGDWRLFFLKRDLIEKVGVADVQRVAENYLRESNRTLGQFIPTDKPQRATIPAAPDVEQLLAGYTGKVAVASGEVFDPTPANIDQRTQTLVLANGMQLALLPKLTRGNLVFGQMVLRLGDLTSLKNKSVVAGLTAAMLERGAGKQSRQAIADALEALKARVQIGGQDGSVIVRFETRKDKLGDVLALLKTILRAPDFPASELEQLKTQAIAALEDQMRQPGAIANNALARHGNTYLKGDPRYAPTFAEHLAEIKAVKLADVKAFHQAFYGAAFGQLALVGDFAAADVQAQAAKLFGDWKSRQPYQRIDRPVRSIPATTLALETPDKPNATYLARLSFSMRDDANDFPAILLAERVLGGGGLKSRLVDRLRQKEGISYGAGSQFSLTTLDQRGDLTLYASFAPQYQEKVKTAIAEELSRLYQDGITSEELAEAKTGTLQENQLARGEDATLAGLLAANLFLKRTMAFSAKQEARLNDTTLAEVNAAIRQYLDPQKLVHVYAGDFAGAAKKAK